MNMRSISLNQFMTLIVLYLIGGSMLVNIGRYAGQNIWIVLLIGGVLGSGLFTVYHRISKLHDYKGLPDILRDCFGKWFGMALIIVYAGFFLFRTVMMGNSMTGMVLETLMYGANHHLVVTLLLTTVMFGALYGLKTIGRSSEFLFVVAILCLLPFLTTAFSAGVFKSTNLVPVLAEGMGGIRQDIFRVTAFPYGELVAFLMFFPFVSKKQSSKILKRGYIAILMATLLLIAIELTNVAVLGTNLSENFLYPFYSAMQLAGMNGLLERLDPLAAIIIIVTGYFKGVLYFYAGILAIQSLNQKFNYKWILFIVSLGIFIFAPYIQLGQVDFVLHALPFKILPIFQLAIPLVVWIVSEIKYGKKKKAEREKLATT